MCDIRPCHRPKTDNCPHVTQHKLQSSTHQIETGSMPAISLGAIDIPETAITWKFLRSSGPGGQNVNKVATAVECRLDLDRAELPKTIRARLEKLAGSRLAASGEIVVFADAQRTQARNRADALARLSALIETARQVPKPRIPSKPSAAQKAKRREDKQRRSVLKEQRRHPRDV